MKQMRSLVVIVVTHALIFLVTLPAHSSDVFRVRIDEFGVMQIDHEASAIWGNFPPPSPWAGEMVIEQHELEYGSFPLPMYPQGGTATMEEIFVTISLKNFAMAIPAPDDPPFDDYISCDVDMSGFEPLLNVGNPIPASSVTFLVTVVAVKQEGSGTPVEIPQGSTVIFDQNYPNPFNPQTTIAFELPRREIVTLCVFDAAGHLVKTLLDGEPYGPGRHEAVWRGTDDAGRRVASGTYLYRMKSGDFEDLRKMTLVK